MKHPKEELTDEEVEQILFDAMRLNNMFPPTVAEVAVLDEMFKYYDLPFGPSDPENLLKRLESK